MQLEIVRGLQKHLNGAKNQQAPSSSMISHFAVSLSLFENVQIMHEMCFKLQPSVENDTY